MCPGRLFAPSAFRRPSSAAEGRQAHRLFTRLPAGVSHEFLIMDSRRRAGPRFPPTYRRSLVMTRSLRNGRGSVRRNELRSQAARHPASPSARSLLETTAPWRRRVVGRSPQIQPWAMPRARGLLLWQTRQYWSRSMFWEDPPAPGKVEVEERRLGRRRPDEDQPPAVYIVRRRRESGTMALAARFAARTMVVLSDVVAGDCPCSDRAFGKWTEAMRRVSTPTTSAATKTDYRLLMQRCGFGVQDLDRALWTVRTC